MLALDVGYTELEVEVTVGVDSALYTSTPAEADVARMLEAMCAWFNDPAFAWYGSTVFSWSWARDPATGGAVVTLQASAAFDLVSVAGANPFHWNTGTGQTSYAGTTVADGTWAPESEIAVSRHYRLLGQGECGGGNLVRPGAPGLAGIRPRVEAIGSAVDAGRLAALLADARSPRVATVYERHRDAWRTLALGQVDRSRSGTQHYRFALDCAGEAV